MGSDRHTNPTLADWLATAVEPDDPTEAAPPHLPKLSLGEGPMADLAPRELLGVGGTAVVSLGQQRALGRDVAIKRSKHAADPRAVKALLREAWITGQIDHPNVVPVHLLGETDEGEPVVVLRAIGGEDWHERLRSDPADDPEALNRHLAVFVAVCNAVHFAHERGFVHRDIKPSNVQIGAFGEAYLLDWGIAARLDEATVSRAGTPTYMAPEMFDKGPPDRRSDVFLLGATLLEVVTGRPPREGRPTEQILAEGSAGPPLAVPDDLPAGLGPILERACAPNPADRYPDAAALRDAVLAWEIDLGVETLHQAARARLDAFLQASDNAVDDDDPAGLEARERFAAARFGFELVLAERPDHAGARAGLGTCLKRMIRIELANGSTAAARALLSAHLDANEAFARQVAEQADALDSRAIEHDRLARLARAYDTTEVARDWGTLLGAGTAAVVLAILGTNLILPPPPAAAEARMIGLLGPPVLVTIAVVAWKRKTLIGHPVGRRLTVSVIGLLAVLSISRAVEMWVGMAPAQIALGDPFFITVWIFGSSAYLRKLLPVGGFGIVGSAVNTALLGHPAQLWFQNLLVIALVAWFSWVWWRALAHREEI